MANWNRYSREIEDNLSKRRLPTNCQKEEKILHAIILKEASHHIPSGRHRLNTEPVPTEILEKMRARDDLRPRDSTLPALPESDILIFVLFYHYQSLCQKRQLITISLSTSFVELSSLELILCLVKLLHRYIFSIVDDPKPVLIFIKLIS